MPSYEHKKLIERIAFLGKAPEDPDKFTTWIKADGHLALLRDNAKEDELIIYGSGIYSFIHAVVVSEENLSPLDKDDLLKWNGKHPFSPCASYIYSGAKDEIWIEGSDFCTNTLKGAQQLVFARTFEGMKGKERLYFEILQEYAHVTGIHWRQERYAYGRFDENGDFDQIVSITSGKDIGDITLVSFKRRPLEKYLAATNSVLVRMFDFTLYRGKNFPALPDGPEKVFKESDDCFYRQKVNPGKGGYTCGVQIIRPRRPKTEIFPSLSGNWPKGEERIYVKFIARDWRNKCITEISTDPAATINYFQTRDNSLPFELSPAFFRSEVLLKYKADKEKYIIDQGNRTIHCRSAWELRSYDVNEAGQIHAYIVYLRSLPYREQLYWKSFNEKPKASISKRALEHDFEGKWSTIVDPLEKVLSILRRWAESELTWWKLRGEALLKRVSTPYTSSRDEWANAFMDLSKLVIEGFQIRDIRNELGGIDIAFDEKEGSIVLLEKFLNGQDMINDCQKLEGLRTVQHIRSTFAHSSGDKAADLANNALQEHGAFSAHFESVCETVAGELKLIEEAFS